jgi:hypothetical protein
VRDAATAVGFYRDLDQDGNLVTFFQWVQP